MVDPATQILSKLISILEFAVSALPFWACVCIVQPSASIVVFSFILMPGDAVSLSAIIQGSEPGTLTFAIDLARIFKTSFGKTPPKNKVNSPDAVPIILSSCLSNDICATSNFWAVAESSKNSCPSSEKLGFSEFKAANKVALSKVFCILFFAESAMLRSTATATANIIKMTVTLNITAILPEVSLKNSRIIQLTS